MRRKLDWFDIICSQQLHADCYLFPCVLFKAVDFDFNVLGKSYIIWIVIAGSVPHLIKIFVLNSFIKTLKDVRTDITQLLGNINTNIQLSVTFKLDKYEDEHIINLQSLKRSLIKLDE